MVTVGFLQSAMATQTLLNANGVATTWSVRCGDPFIAKCRSKLVKDFLDHPDCTDFFFLDDDLTWPAPKVLEFVQSDVPVLAGIYPKKQDAPDWPVALAADPETGELFEEDGLIRAKHAPTGFLRIKRHVLEKVFFQSQVFREIEADGVTREFRAVFNSGPAHDGLWWGEDFAFCNTLEHMGIEIWIDPDIEFRHMGDKTWKGSILGHIGKFKARAAEKAVNMKSNAA
jgi:hypothetical protein